MQRGRQYVWSYYGQIHNDDRKQMLSTLAATKPNSYGWRKHITTIASIYKDARFVPVGSGIINLETMHMQEALSNGAIPIIVAPNDFIR